MDNNKKYLAYFDILGYKNRIENVSLLEEYQIQKNLLAIKAA